MTERIMQFGDQVVFCKGCGQLAGAPTKCLVWSSHSFVTMPAGIYVCKGCGATVGTASKCEAWSSHSFVRMDK